ncbi:tRNA (adenosine(37)-N6)-threonylcarbamoyltransferase complex transferase subunit TsaD [Candidatus Kaiserbacteria bacterium]|nr:MAG: tRNA (adenosine(37)-N6)-threonylcarbamoyltransferase complex transferase subunit TsaD [Candidatus Kaiserbacteria bacterium]
MRILSVETSCDETGLSIVDTQRSESGVSVEVRADTLLSQALLHAEYGGVYPSLAKREHAKNLGPLLIETLKQADMFTPAKEPKVTKETIQAIKELLYREPELFVHLTTLLINIEKPDIDVIAVTHGPGLEPALWVGVNFAKALSLAWNIPVMPLNHMEGHLAAAFTTEVAKKQYTLSKPQLPALIMLISGGHTELVLLKKWFSTENRNDYEKIGSTRDDAVGEAFDKTARLLGLPYPGGIEIAKLAEAAREENLPHPYSLPRPMLKTDDYDFSFSGLKTAARNLVQNIGNPTDEQKKQIAREIEDAITEVLVTKTKRAIEEYGIRSLAVGGGVSASTHIRAALEALIEEYEDMTLYKPARELSTDNGLMIAFAAAMNTYKTDNLETISANGNLSID